MNVQLISPLEPSDPLLAELARLESRLPAAEPPWLRAVRRRALARFGELGFPGRRDEDWKYTDVSTIAERPLRIALPGDIGPLGTGAAGVEAGRIDARSGLLSLCRAGMPGIGVRERTLRLDLGRL